MTLFVRKTLRLLVLYGPLLFIPAFLYLAYNYISFQSPKYKVSASISVGGVSPQSVIKDLKSKDILGKALDQVPLEASYFFSDQPRHEIYPDSSPVKVVVKSLTAEAKPVWISLHVTDSHQFELTRGDTSEFDRFNVPVTESYGTFTVVRNNRADSAGRPVNVKMLTRDQTAIAVDNDLFVGTGRNKDAVQLALVTGNPKKGIDFLRALLNIYSGTIARDNNDAAPAAQSARTAQYDTIRKPAKDVKALRDKATELATQITSLKEQEKSAGMPVPVKRGSIDKNQEKIYQAVDSYVKQPIDQFVQVPYVDEIEDPDLNDQVNQFNEMELSRRHYSDQAQIDSVNRKLMELRSGIVERVRVYLRSGHSGSGTRPPESYYEDQIAGKQRRLDDINKEINAAGTTGFTVVKSNKVKPVSVARVSSRLVVLDKPEDNVEYIPVNSGIIYGVAFLAGLLFPIAGWIVRVVHKNSSSRRLPDAENLNGQINDLSHVNR